MTDYAQRYTTERDHEVRLDDSPTFPPSRRPSDTATDVNPKAWEGGLVASALSHALALDVPLSEKQLGKLPDRGLVPTMGSNETSGPGTAQGQLAEGITLVSGACTLPRSC